MAKKKRDEASGDSWLNTYADMVTLLMCFFVLQLSFSSVNAEKWEQFVKAFVNPGEDTSQIVLNVDDAERGTGPLPNISGGSEAGGGTSPESTEDTVPEEFSDLYNFLKQYVEEKGLQGSIEVSKGGENVVYIRFQNNVFFEPDKYYLRTQAREILDYVGDCIHSVQDEIYIISINGHTAEVQYEYAVSDWMLSSERASSVAIYLDDEKDIDPKKIRPVGYGKNYPIADNTTQQGREKNRRVDITIVKDRNGGPDGGWSAEELASLFDPTKFPKSGDSMDVLSPEKAPNPPVEPGTPEPKPETEGIYNPSDKPDDGQSMPTEVIPGGDDLMNLPQPVEEQENILPPVNDGNS